MLAREGSLSSSDKEWRLAFLSSVLLLPVGLYIRLRWGVCEQAP